MDGLGNKKIGNFVNQHSLKILGVCALSVLGTAGMAMRESVIEGRRETELLERAAEVIDNDLDLDKTRPYDERRDNALQALEELTVPAAP